MHIFKKRQNPYKTKLQKKAQSSFFVIAGIFLFVAMIVGFVVYNNINSKKAGEEAKKISDLGLQAEEVKNLVNECIRKASLEGLKKLGQTGGYLEVPTLINFKGMGYWHLDQINIQPFLNQTQERLIEYVDANVPSCVDEQKISQLGFKVEKGRQTTFIEFGTADVTIKVNYPIKLSQQDFTKEYSEFFNTFDIRYRAIFEAASELNEKTFEADFDGKNPLKNLDYLKNLEFDAAYKNPETDILAFIITDKKSITSTNEFYTFSFAARFGNSELKRATDLQNRSASVSNPLPYTIFSVDKKAQLDISAGTTINKDGQDVSFISVQQSYPSEAITKDVPVYKKNDQVIQKQDITYKIDNPVYSFEPSGLLFNNFQKLTLYYSPETDDSKGMGILMGKNGFWIPITSQHDPVNKKVSTGILGFTEFTAVSCATQKAKETIAEHLFEPNAGCYISLAILVIALILIVVAFVIVPVVVTVAPVAGGVTAGTTVVGGTSVAAGSSVVAGSSATVVAGSTTIGTAGALAGGSVTAGGVTATSAGYFASLGSALVGGAAISTGVATAIGISFVLISTASTILGATTDVFYGKSPDNCETFYPTCDQTISVEEGGDADEGQCIPGQGQRVAAGTPVNICAQVESCGNFIDKTLCKSCSQKCTAKFT